MKQVRNRIRESAINHINKQDEMTRKNFKEVHSHYKQERAALRPFKKIIVAGLIFGAAWLGISQYNDYQEEKQWQQYFEEAEEISQKYIDEQNNITYKEEVLTAKGEARLKATSEIGCKLVDANGKEFFASKTHDALKSYGSCANDNQYIVTYREVDGNKIFESITQAH